MVRTAVYPAPNRGVGAAPAQPRVVRGLVASLRRCGPAAPTPSSSRRRRCSRRRRGSSSRAEAGAAWCSTSPICGPTPRSRSGRWKPRRDRRRAGHRALRLPSCRRDRRADAGSPAGAAGPWRAAREGRRRPARRGSGRFAVDPTTRAGRRAGRVLRDDRDGARDATLIDAARRLEHADGRCRVPDRRRRGRARRARGARRGAERRDVLRAHAARRSCPALLASAQVTVVTQRDLPFLADALSTKVLEYMASGAPVAAAVSGWTAEVIERAGAGIVCPPEQPEELGARDRAVDRRSRGRSRDGPERTPLRRAPPDPRAGGGSAGGSARGDRPATREDARRTARSARSPSPRSPSAAARRLSGRRSSGSTRRRWTLSGPQLYVAPERNRRRRLLELRALPRTRARRRTGDAGHHDQRRARAPTRRRRLNASGTPDAPIVFRSTRALGRHDPRRRHGDRRRLDRRREATWTSRGSRSRASRRAEVDGIAHRRQLFTGGRQPASTTSPARAAPNGGIVAGDADYAAHGIAIIGNYVHDIGQGPRDGSCSLLHGIYAAVPGVVVANNLVVRALGDGITSWHAAARLTDRQQHGRRQRPGRHPARQRRRGRDRRGQHRQLRRQQHPRVQRRRRDQRGRAPKTCPTRSSPTSSTATGATSSTSGIRARSGSRSTATRCSPIARRTTSARCPEAPRCVPAT